MAIILFKEKPPYQAMPEESFVFKEWLKKLQAYIYYLGVLFDDEIASMTAAIDESNEMLLEIRQNSIDTKELITLLLAAQEKTNLLLIEGMNIRGMDND